MCTAVLLETECILQYIETINILFTQYLGPTVGRYSIRFSLPEFVSYLGERGVLCVGNGWHFCTPVLMNMSNITFEDPRLSTFVFKVLKIYIFTIIFVVMSSQSFGWNNVGPASQTVAHRYFTIGPMYCVISAMASRGIKGQCTLWRSELR